MVVVEVVTAVAVGRSMIVAAHLLVLMLVLMLVLVLMLMLMLVGRADGGRGAELGWGGRHVGRGGLCGIGGKV